MFAEFIDSYEFVSLTSFHSPWVAGLSIVGYILMVILLPRILKGSKPVNMSQIMFAHNYFLSLLSIIMFVGVVRAVSSIYLRVGLYELLCDLEGNQRNSRLYFYIVVFYLSKFYEFIDTLILILRQVCCSCLFFFGFLFHLTSRRSLPVLEWTRNR